MCPGAHLHALTNSKWVGEAAACVTASPWAPSYLPPPMKRPNLASFHFAHRPRRAERSPNSRQKRGLTAQCPTGKLVR
jgi:hypothetical protein